MKKRGMSKSVKISLIVGLIIILLLVSLFAFFPSKDEKGLSSIFDLDIFQIFQGVDESIGGLLEDTIYTPSVNGICEYGFSCVDDYGVYGICESKSSCVEVYGGVEIYGSEEVCEEISFCSINDNTRCCPKGTKNCDNEVRDKCGPRPNSAKLCNTESDNFKHDQNIIVLGSKNTYAEGYLKMFQWEMCKTAVQLFGSDEVEVDENGEIDINNLLGGKHKRVWISIEETNTESDAVFWGFDHLDRRLHKLWLVGTCSEIMNEHMPHEVNHVFISSMNLGFGGMLDAWGEKVPNAIDEGLAVLLSNDGERQTRACRTLGNGGGLTFDEIISMKIGAGDGDLGYGKAFAFASYLMSLDGGKSCEATNKYYKFMKRGLEDREMDNNWEESLKRYYGFDSKEDFDRKFDSWLRAGCCGSCLGSDDSKSASSGSSDEGLDDSEIQFCNVDLWEDSDNLDLNGVWYVENLNNCEIRNTGFLSFSEIDETKGRVLYVGNVQNSFYYPYQYYTIEEIRDNNVLLSLYSSWESLEDGNVLDTMLVDFYEGVNEDDNRKIGVSMSHSLSNKYFVLS